MRDVPEYQSPLGSAAGAGVSPGHPLHRVVHTRPVFVTKTTEDVLEAIVLPADTVLHLCQPLLDTAGLGDSAADFGGLVIHAQCYSNPFAVRT